jgi:hypothetical protein
LVALRWVPEAIRNQQVAGWIPAGGVGSSSGQNRYGLTGQPTSSEIAARRPSNIQSKSPSANKKATGCARPTVSPSLAERASWTTHDSARTTGLGSPLSGASKGFPLLARRLPRPSVVFGRAELSGGPNEHALRGPHDVHTSASPLGRSRGRIDRGTARQLARTLARIAPGERGPKIMTVPAGRRVPACGHTALGLLPGRSPVSLV